MATGKSIVLGVNALMDFAKQVKAPAGQKVQRERAEMYLHVLVEASDDAIIGLDIDGTVLSWNKGAEKILGYRAGEILGQPVSVLEPPGHPNESHETIMRLQRDEHTLRFEAECLHKDGHPIDVSVTISPVKSKDGTVVGASVVARDITEYRKAQNTILGLRALVEASDDAIIGKTIDGTIISWNKGAEKIYGYKEEEILGKSISVLMPPGHPNEFPEIMMRLQRGEHVEKYETKRLHKDGHHIDVSVTISPVKSKDGTVVGASVVARDITLQKQADQALRLSEERFRVALKNAPVVVCSQDLELRYTWVNSTVLAWHDPDYLGRTDVEILGGEDGARLTAIKEDVLRTGIGSQTETTVTFAGVKHYFDLVVEPLRDSRGKLQGLLSSAIDTTPLKGTIVKLKEALNQVQLLSGLLPICASCKRIKDEREMWQPLEVYIQKHSEAKFTHGVCPDCLRKLYPEYYP